MQLSDTSLISDANLEAYFKFESGALTTDSSGDGETLTNTGTAIDGTGIWGGAADFGTTNSTKYFERASAAGIQRTFTMSCWVKMNTEIGSGIQNFMEHVNDTTDNIFELQYDYNAGTRRVVAKNYKVGGGDASATETYTITLGTTTWHHLAMTGDGTTVKLYVDGVERDSGNMVASGSNSLDNRIVIGANRISTGGGYGDAGPNRYASALIDDAAYFSRALNATEIALLAQLPSGGFFGLM